MYLTRISSTEGTFFFHFQIWKSNLTTNNSKMIFLYKYSSLRQKTCHNIFGKFYQIRKEQIVCNSAVIFSVSYSIRKYRFENLVDSLKVELICQTFEEIFEAIKDDNVNGNFEFFTVDLIDNKRC